MNFPRCARMRGEGFGRLRLPNQIAAVVAAGFIAPVPFAVLPMAEPRQKERMAARTYDVACSC